MSAHLGLGHAANRKHRARQFGLINHVHYVALVFGSIGATLEFEFAQRCVGGRSDPSMMARGYRIETKQRGALAEPRKLHVAVALDAWVRRDALGVGLHIGSHDVLVEVFGEVEHEMVDAELLRHATRIVDIGHAATAGVALATPQSHRDTHDLVALLY